MNTPTLSPEEERARHRYMTMNAARFGGIGVTIIGLLAAREVLPLPYALAVVLVLAGIGGFFFGPPFLVKRWKAQDRANGEAE